MFEGDHRESETGKIVMHRLDGGRSMTSLSEFGLRRIRELTRHIPPNASVGFEENQSLEVPIADRGEGLERNDHLISGDFRSRFEHLSRYSMVCEGRWHMIADIGCGTGYGTALLSSKSLAVGIDVSEEAVRYAKTTYYNCDFIVGDGTAIPLADDSFDAVTAFEVIEHLSEPERLFNECRRILKKDGILFLSSPNPAHIGNLLRMVFFRIPIPSKVEIGNQYHIREFTYDEMLSSISAHGYELVWSVGQTLPFDQLIPGISYVIRRTLKLLHLADSYDWTLSTMGGRFPRLSWTVVYAVRRK